VGDDTLGVGLDAEELTDLAGADDGHDGLAGEAVRLRARLVWFPGADAGRTHGYQFSLITYVKLVRLFGLFGIPVMDPTPVRSATARMGRKGPCSLFAF
jgi:hypothetical protein